MMQLSSARNCDEIGLECVEIGLSGGKLLPCGLLGEGFYAMCHTVSCIWYVCTVFSILERAN